MDAAYGAIIQNVAKIYDGYEVKANEMAIKKTGPHIDKNEATFIEKLRKIEPDLQKLLLELEKSELTKG